ncbi:FAD-dependent oxidoreductase [Clostridium aminobutyricum]|nr:FAD-dependent oxidoreductase [Clostridium aminobutyricum]
MKEVIIVGNGLAGLSAAMEASDLGAKVMLISQAPPERAQSVMAAGGINAALNTKGQDDSPQQHLTDTLKAGCELADPEAVEAMTKAAPELIKKLSRLGVVFSRDESGNVNLRYFGGQKKRRTAFSKSAIGKQLMCGLAQHVRKLEARGAITVKENSRFLSAVIEQGKCLGGIFENTITGQIFAITGDALILATGGMNGVFGNTTGSVLSEGSATAAVFRQGVKLGNGEMIQYHPTTVETKGKRMLISEAARGEGGRLFTYKDGKPWYFMEEWYPEGGNLMPRDVVSKGIYRVCHDLNLGIDGKNLVYLDISFLSKQEIELKLREISDLCKTYLKIDPTKEYIPVYPGIHYFMGGIYVDKNHESSVEGLYAAGECACQYHGANRLGGNSTLGAIYGGMVAAKNAVSGTPEKEDYTTNAEWIQYKSKCAEREVAKIQQRVEQFRTGTIVPNQILLEMRDIMNKAMGIERNEGELREGIKEINRLAEKAKNMALGKLQPSEAIAAENMLVLGKSLLLSALERKESRGAQLRKDYPQRDDEQYKRTTVAAYFEDGTIEISFKRIGEGAM